MIRQCSNGHIFDDSISSVCPLCGQQAAAPKAPTGNEPVSSISPVLGWLVCTAGPDKGKVFRIDQPVSRIGRAGTQNYDIDLSDPKISRAEPIAAVSFNAEDNSFTLSAYPSGNLTPFLQGRPVLSMEPLRSYDVIGMGDSTLVFRALCCESFGWE